MTRGPFPFRAGLARLVVSIVAPISVGAGLAACGSTTPSAASSTNGSCVGVAGAHHARVVVQSAPGKVVAHCIGFSSTSISATTLLAKSKVELGTQQYSFGLAICQVDNIPAHYSQCLPSGQNYWALFTSRNGAAWTSPSVGVAQITLGPGDTLGLAYDSPQGNPAPPPAPSPA